MLAGLFRSRLLSADMADPVAPNVECAGPVLSRRPAREPDAAVRPERGGAIFELIFIRPETKWPIVGLFGVLVCLLVSSLASVRSRGLVREVQAAV
ncbi:hypothetical protein OG828_47370 [Streptomyces sp. NBC_00457]|uniref:hypothetical protein n=1 Tax=Streptomyces sp. NBC_00457 TaxID=2975748 RepID=UPI002E2131A3